MQDCVSVLIRKHQVEVALTFSDKLAVAAEWKGSGGRYKSCKPVFRREAVFPVCVNEMFDDSLYWIF